MMSVGIMQSSLAYLCTGDTREITHANLNQVSLIYYNGTFDHTVLYDMKFNHATNIYYLSITNTSQI